MRFLWFGKKKSAEVAPIEEREAPTPVEVFSISNFVIESNPQPTVKGTELSHQAIHSLALSILAQNSKPADIAAQEFFQERGATLLPVSDFTSSADRGYSGRVRDGQTIRNVLIGAPSVISRATTPWCESIIAATRDSTNTSVIAVDGIAYAAFTITSELQ
jgi:hypothetical protein